MLKKFLAVIMTGAMVLALAVPAFASESLYDWGVGEESNATDPESSKLDLTALVKTPTLKIGVGQGAGVVFNPAQMKIDRSSTTLLDSTIVSNGASALTGTTQDQVISNETSIKNFSNVPVKMYAKAVATEGIGNIVEFTDGSIDDNEHDKKVHLFCEVIRNDSGEGPKLTGDDDTNDYTTYYVEQMESDEDIQKRQGWDGRKNQFRISAEDREDYDNEDNYVMIFAENTNVLSGTAPSVSTSATVANAASGKMKFFGSMTKNPTVPWSGTDDAIQFTVTMKFEMQSNEVEES